MSALFYDPILWRKELDFWPSEVEMTAYHPRQLLVQRCAELLAHLLDFGVRGELRFLS